MKRFTAFFLSLAVTMSLIATPVSAAVDDIPDAGAVMPLADTIERIDLAQHFLVRHWHTWSGFTILEGYIVPKSTSGNSGYDFYITQYKNENGETAAFRKVENADAAGDYIRSLNSATGEIVLEVIPDLDSRGNEIEQFAGFSITTGQSVAEPSENKADLNQSTLKIKYDENIRLVKSHVFYTSMTQLGSSSTDHFPSDQPWKDVDLSDGKVYNSTTAGLHTNKTVTGVDDRFVDLELESWYAGGRSAYVGMILDASGSMAFASDKPSPIKVPDTALAYSGVAKRPYQNADTDWSKYILPQRVVDELLKPQKTDSSPLGESGYTYYIFDNRSNTVEYVPLAYWEGTKYYSSSDPTRLTVNLTVAGTGADADKPFTFTVTMTNTTVNGTYSGVSFSNGVGSFTLTGNEKKKTIAGLPAGGYSVSVKSESGYDVPQPISGQTLYGGGSSTVDCKIVKTVPDQWLGHYTFAGKGNLGQVGGVTAVRQESGTLFGFTNSGGNVNINSTHGLNITTSTAGVKLGAQPSGNYTVSFKITKVNADTDTPQDDADILYTGPATVNSNQTYFRIYRSKDNVDRLIFAPYNSGTSKAQNTPSILNEEDTNTSHIITVVFNTSSGNYLRYVDGTKKGNDSNSTVSLANSGNIIVFNGFADTYDGPDLYIDDIYVYDFDLDRDQVTYLVGGDPSLGTSAGSPSMTAADETVGAPHASGTTAVTNGDKTIGVFTDPGAYNNTANNAGWYYVSHSNTWNYADDYGTNKTLRGLNGDGSYPNSSYTEYLPEGRTASTYTTYSQNDYTPLKFFVDEGGYLHCFYSWGNNAANKGVSFVYEMGDMGYVKTEALQRAIGSFVTKLNDASPTSVVSAVRFSSEEVTTPETRKQLVLLDWTNDPVESTGILSLQRGDGSARGITMSTPPGWENATEGIAQYNYGLTGDTMTYSGMLSFIKNLHSRLPNEIQTDDGTTYGKYVILFTDGLDDHHENAYTQATELKKAGYTVIAVMLAGGSVSPDSGSQFSQAATFLKKVSGPPSDAEANDENSAVFFYADDVDELVDLFSEDILNMVVNDLDGYTVQDYIDPRFDVVAANGDVWHLNAGGSVTITTAAGGSTKTSVSADGAEITLSNIGDGRKGRLCYDSGAGLYYLKWTNQSIPGVEVGSSSVKPWQTYITLKAKDDFLGGNAVLTNGNASGQNYIYKGTGGSSGYGNASTEDPDTAPPSKGFPRVTANIKAIEGTHTATDSLYLGEDGNLLLDANFIQASPYFEYLTRYQKHHTGEYGTLNALLEAIRNAGGAGLTLDYYYYDGDDAATVLAGDENTHQKDKLGSIQYTWLYDASGDKYTLTAKYTADTRSTDADVNVPLVTEEAYKWNSGYKSAVGDGVTEKAVTDVHTIDRVSGQIVLEVDLSQVAPRLKSGDSIKYVAELYRQYTEDNTFKNPVKVGTYTANWAYGGGNLIVADNIAWESGYNYSTGLPIGNYYLTEVDGTDGTSAPPGVTFGDIAFRVVTNSATDKGYFQSHFDSHPHSFDAGKHLAADFIAPHSGATAQLGTVESAGYLDHRYAIAVVKAEYGLNAVEDFFISGEKLVNGGSTWSGDSSFTLTLSAQGSTPLPNVKTATVISGDNAFSFGPITYTEEGSYTYTVTETGKGGFTDVRPADSYTVTVKVIQDGADLKVESVTYSSGGASQNELVFNNVNFKPEKKLSAVKGSTTATNGSLQVGDLLTYTITWRNYQADTATVTVSDTLMKGLEYVIANPTPDPGTTTPKSDGTTPLTWTFADRPAGTGGTITLYARVTEDAVTSDKVTNQAGVKVGSDAEVKTTPVENKLDKGKLIVEKTVVGEESSTQPFTFTVNFTYDAENMGGNKATQTALSGEYDYTSTGTPTAGKIKSGGSFTLHHGEAITITGLPAGASYTVSENTPSDYRAVYAPATSGTISATSDAKVTVTNYKMQEIGKTEVKINEGAVEDTGSGLPKVQVGDTITYEIAWANNDGDGRAVTVKDVLGTGLAFVKAGFGAADKVGTWYEADGTPVDGITVSAQTVTWTLPNTKLGDSGIVTVVVKVTEDALQESDTVRNSASVKVGNGAEQKTDEVENTIGTGGLIITKVVKGADSGDNETFTFTLTLTGLEGQYRYTASNATVTSSGAARGYLKNGATITMGSGGSVTIEGLPSGAGYQVAETANTKYTTTVQVGSGAATPGTATSGSDKIGDGTTTVTFTNIKKHENSKKVTQVNGEDDNGQGGVKVGDKITYTIRWANNTDKAAAITVTDTLQTGLAFVSASDSGTESGGKVTWNLGERQPGSSGFVTVTVLVTEDAVGPGQVENGADIQIGSDSHVEIDPVATNVNKDGKLTVKKAVVGDTEKASFDFTVSFWYLDKDGARVYLSGDYTYSGSVQKSTAGGHNAYTFSLAKDGSITISGLPEGVHYEVVETDPGDGATTTYLPRQSDTVAASSSVTVTNLYSAENTKTSDVDPNNGVNVGQEITYTIQWTNNTLDTATVTITDTLSDGLAFVKAKIGAPAEDGAWFTSGGAAVEGISLDGQTVTWILKNVGPWASGTVTVVARVTEDALVSGYVKNQASVQINDDPTVNTTSPTDDKVNTGSLKITKTIVGSDPDTSAMFPVQVTLEDASGTPLSGTYTASNYLNEKVTFVSGSYTFLLRHGQSVTISGLPAGASYEVTETPVPSGYHVEYSRKTGAIVATGGTQAAAEVKNHQDVENTKTVDKATAQIGDELTYTIHWANNDAQARQVTITDKLSEGLTFLSATAGTVTLSGTNTVTGTDSVLGSVTISVASDGTVTWNLGQQPAFSGGDVTVKATVNSKAVTYDEITNTAGLSYGDDPAISTKPVSTTLEKGGLTVTKEVLNGTDGPFTITVTLGDTSINGAFGGMNFINGVATLTLPGGGSATASGLPAGISYSVAEAAYGQDGYVPGYTVKYDGKVSGSIVANATISTTVTNHKNGENSKTVNVVADEIQVGKILVYTIHWVNNTAQEADVVITDTLTGLDYIISDNGGVYHETASGTAGQAGYIPANTVVWTLRRQPAFSSGDVTVTVRVNESAVVPGQVENTAAIQVGGDTATATAPTKTVQKGNLSISKTVVDTVTDETFTVKVYGFYDVELLAPGAAPSVTPLSGTYTVTGLADTTSITFENGEASFRLKHSDMVTIQGLPAGAYYTVVETESGNFTPEYDGAESGYIPGGDTAGTTITNRTSGGNDKTVSKTRVRVGDIITYTIKWSNNSAAPATVTITDKLPDGLKFVSASNNATESGGTITWNLGQQSPFAHGQVTVTVEVTEAALKYDKITNNATIDFGGGVTYTPSVDVTAEKGELTVSKTVVGNGADTNKEFSFTVTLTGSAISGTFGGMTFTGGVANFSLKHGQSVTAKDLPAGVAYTVTEAADGDYTATATGATGTIPDGSAAFAAFTNTRNTGNLVVMKMVSGFNGDTNKDFRFTVTLTDTTINGAYDGMTFTNGVTSFTLKHGESAVATGLPAGITYTVAEDDYSGDGYVTVKSGETGAIETDVTKLAQFINVNGSEEDGGLTVLKVVTGTAGDPARDFHFTVTLDDPTLTGTYGGMDFTAGVASFTLRHAQSKTATGLPAGVGYTVAETDADASGYGTTYTGQLSGTVEKGEMKVVMFTNHKDKDEGNLTVAKFVNGSDGDRTKGFDFTVTLGDESINGVYGGITFVNGVAHFTLAHGERKTAAGLPKDVTYTVTEADYTGEGYAVTVDNANGVIPDGDTVTATFINHKDATSGSLTVVKMVTGTGGETDKDFHFTVTLSDHGISDTYGEMTFTNGVAQFTLTHGQHRTATGLPAGLEYTVTETEANADGYATTFTGEAGVIANGGVATATFVNHRGLTSTGDLTVTKVVSGNAGSQSTPFTFTVELSDKTITGIFGDMEFTNGAASFTLKHGEKRTAVGLPSGVSYTVKETEANQNGYTTVATGDTGVIGTGGTATATFNNSKSTSGGGGGSSNVSTRGGLTVRKMVTGLYGDRTKQFQFTVTLDRKSVNGTYGDMVFKNGVAQFTLAHGESKTAVNLASGINYKVTETPDENYTTTSAGESGTITQNATASAVFVNDWVYAPPDILNSQGHYGYIIGYPSGDVAPYGNITRAEVVTILFRLLTDEARTRFWSQKNPFSDVNSGDWFNNAVSTLYSVGVIEGRLDGTFCPNDAITRAELAALIARFFEVDESVTLEHPFTDVPADGWYARYVDIAAALGLVEGYEGGFRPNDNLTRAEAMTMFNRLLNHHPHADKLLNTMIRWPDNMDPSAWYYAEVQEATNSHESEDNWVNGKLQEVWLKLLPMRDWAALETEWANANGA